MKHLSIILTILAALTIGLTACEKDVRQTTIVVLDSVRHYYPILQGKELPMVWRIANIGESPLVITDIMPSCGCICAEEKDGMVLAPGKEAALHFTFNSDKYTGYVNHTIRLYGNIYPKGIAELRFDTNVVPSYDASPDYEEFYKDHEDPNWDELKSQRRAYEVDENVNSSYSEKIFMNIDQRK